MYIFPDTAFPGKNDKGTYFSNELKADRKQGVKNSILGHKILYFASQVARAHSRNHTPGIRGFGEKGRDQKEGDWVLIKGAI